VRVVPDGDGFAVNVTHDGTDTDAIVMWFNDYRRFAHPKLVHIAFDLIPLGTAER
jgi:hypothetical protein